MTADAASLERELVRQWQWQTVEGVSVLKVAPPGWSELGAGRSVLYQVTLDGRNYLGYARLERGFAGRYRFGWLGHTGSPLLYARLGQFGDVTGYFIAGLNPGISQIGLATNTAELRIDLKLQPDFACFLPGIGELSITCYGEQGQDITANYPDLAPTRGMTCGTGTPTAPYIFGLVMLTGAGLAVAAWKGRSRWT